MKKVLAIVLILVMVFAMASCGKKESVDIFAKSEGTMTYDQYMAAAEGDKVVIEGFVQSAAYNAKYGNVNLFLQDDKGAYYVYRAAYDDALAAKLVEGAKVKVEGDKTGYIRGDLVNNVEGDISFKCLFIAEAYFELFIEINRSFQYLFL